MRRVLPALALACLLVVAGCNFGPGGSGSSGLSEEERPPGVEDARLTDANALLSAHTAALTESGFETDVKANATVNQSGKVRQVERHQQSVVEPGASAYSYRLTGPGSQIDVWTNGSAQATRIQVGSRVDYRSGGETLGATVLTGEQVMSRYLVNSEYEIRNVTREGGHAYTALVATNPPDDPEAFPANATDVRNYSSTVVVDERGRVHSFTAGGDYTIEGRDGSYGFEYELLRTDEPTVERPDWAGQALS